MIYCPLCQNKINSENTVNYCKTCDLFYNEKEDCYILVNTDYSKIEFEKMLKLKAFW